MARLFAIGFSLVVIFSADAAERELGFSKFPINEPPKGFRSALTDLGHLGDWRVILDDAPNASLGTKRPVLAQQSRDTTGEQLPDHERFPVLLLTGEKFADFTLTTHFKLVAGDKERMAGLIFRAQDEKNYYCVRASGLGNTLKFFRFVNGNYDAPASTNVPVASGVWHELKVVCKGTSIRCSFDGQQVFPEANDQVFPTGMVGFWTKSDSLSYFADTRIIYTPLESLATVLVRETLAANPRLLGLKIFAPVKGKEGVHIVASKDQTELGQPGKKLEEDVITKDVILFGRDKKSVIVTMGIHDRNGDVMGAVRFVMTDFPGQTEQTAISRVLEIKKRMEVLVRSAKSLVD